MSKEIFFFASRADMLKSLSEIEQKRKIKYIKCGSYESRNYLTINSVNNFDNLGINTCGNHQNESYLVLDESVPIFAREVKQSAGGVKYFIDQMENSESIAFWPSGLYKSNFLICGHIATISNDNVSQDLYKLFSKTFIKGYRKYGRYYIGNEAMQMSPNLRLITMTVDQPQEYDLLINK